MIAGMGHVNMAMEDTNMMVDCGWKLRHYELVSGDRILDIGCGKAFLLYEFPQIVLGIKIHGVDVSKYAIENAKPEVKTIYN